MIGAAMPPKSPELAASVCEMELRAVISSTIMLGSAARTGAFTAAATHKSKGVCRGDRVMLTLSRGAGRVGGACTHTHMYDALAVSHGPCEFTGKLWGKREQLLSGGRSPALRMAPVCTTRQLATESAHTIRRITRDIIL